MDFQLQMGSIILSYIFHACVPVITFSFHRLSFVLTGPEHVHLHQLGLPGKLEEDDPNLIELRHLQTTLLQHLPTGTGDQESQQLTCSHTHICSYITYLTDVTHYVTHYVIALFSGYYLVYFRYMSKRVVGSTAIIEIRAAWNLRF